MRELIIEAARKLLAERGVENFTMSDIAQQAGVARATVFNHFRSKYLLLEAVTEDVLDGYKVLLDLALDEREVQTPSLIRLMFEFMGNGIDLDKPFFRTAFRELAKLGVNQNEGSPSFIARKEALEKLEKLILRGQAKGDLSNILPAEDIAVAVNGVVFESITHFLYDDRAESIALHMARAADVLLCPLETTKEPPEDQDLDPLRTKWAGRVARNPSSG